MRSSGTSAKEPKIAVSPNRPRPLRTSQDRLALPGSPAVSGPDGGGRSAEPRRPVFARLPDVSRFLLPEEELRYQDRRHPIVLAPPLGIVLAVCILAGFIVTTVGAGVVLDLYFVVIIVSVLWFLYRVLRWSRVVLVATDRRVFEVESLIISRATIRPVFRQAVEFIQDPLGERLNYGTILTKTPNGDRVNTFKWIHDPRLFYQAVTDRAV